jgi:hypothetical protein
MAENLHGLLNASCKNTQVKFYNNKYRKAAKKRVAKVDQKKTRHRQEEVQAKSILASKLLYCLNREILRQWISDKGNLYLIKYFIAEGGMEEDE